MSSDSWTEVDMTDPDELLCIVFIPPLVTILRHAESTKGSPLTEEDVLAVRGNAVCMRMAHSRAEALAKSRGYDDISAEDCWNEWQSVRTQFFPT
jgi:hypothetical protein